jgi:hypothetical protein
MTSLSQARQLLRSAAFSAVILLAAAPTALADPQGYLSMRVQPTASATVETPTPELHNAPAPDAEFLSSPEAWDDLAGPSQMARQPEALSGQESGRWTNVAP